MRYKTSFLLLGLLLLAACSNATGWGEKGACGAFGWGDCSKKKKPPSMWCEISGRCEEGEAADDEEGGGGGTAGRGGGSPGVGVDGSTPGGAPGHDSGTSHE